MLTEPNDVWTWLIEGCVVDIKMRIAGLHSDNELLKEQDVVKLIWNTVSGCLIEGLCQSATLIPFLHGQPVEEKFVSGHQLCNEALVLGLTIHTCSFRSPAQDETFLVGGSMILGLRIYEAILKEMGIMFSLATNPEAFHRRYIADWSQDL